MFTGIVTDIGRVRAVNTESGDRHFEIETRFDMDDVALGASIACAGACLTVVDKGPGWFAVDVSAETLSRTTLGDWTVGSRMNLERSLKVGDELGGISCSAMLMASAPWLHAVMPAILFAWSLRPPPRWRVSSPRRDRSPSTVFP